jgi:transposase
MVSITSANSETGSEPRRLRLRRANRHDVIRVPARLEDLIAPDHLARLMWEMVEQLDLSAFCARIKVFDGEPGAPAIDPRILITLWLYAISQGVSSAREIDELRVTHIAYIWISGGVDLNYHTLSDFRTDYEHELDELMTQVVKRLEAAGLVELSTQGQDGMRVRASAGAASFRRQPTLEKALEQAQARVVEVEQAGQAEPDPRTARQQAAQERAAQERVARLEAALDEMPAARAAKKPEEQDKARVSSTDPEARVMKMPDGGYRPAYNWQFSVELSNFVITGVDVTNIGSDKAQMEPMVEQVVKRTNQLPKNWLVDGGFIKFTAIEALAGRGVAVFGPVPEPRDENRDR